MTDIEKRQLKEKYMEEIDGIVDLFLDDFGRVCDDGGGVPALSEIEDAAGLLDERTRSVLSGLIHSAIETLDEEAVVESKKAS